MKVLNLYAGIGGNRKLWTDCDVTAVEMDEEIAKVYQDYFPNDKVVVGDAHQYLLDHYKEFDFIWSSPPCPSHSDIRRCGVHSGQVDAIYPEMALYQEIILLKHYAPKETKWVIENVVPYYKPLIPENSRLHRHLYWCNFKFSKKAIYDLERRHNDIQGNSTVYGFNLKGTDIDDKRKTLRNMVDPELGLHIFNAARNIVTKSKTNQGALNF
jgi:DNA (cytosine-5)-methyltransferase 1